MKVGFRLDVGRRLGMGHFTRCSVLARHLQERLRAECVFLISDPDSILTTQPGLDIRPVDRFEDERADAAACKARLCKFGRLDWLVLDHYGLGAQWLSEMFPSSNAFLAIDDLADRSLPVDVLVNQNLLADPESEYRRLVREDTTLLCGPAYAMLREEFASTPVDAGRNGVFVCFGGTDSENWSGVAMEALTKPEGRNVRVVLLISGVHSARRELEDYARENPEVEIHIDSRNVAKRMAGCEIGVGAGGVMTWERCRTGLPSIAWPVADNQRKVLQAADAAGVVRMIDSADAKEPGFLRKQVFDLLSDDIEKSRMRERATRLVDGLGVARVADEMIRFGAGDATV